MAATYSINDNTAQSAVSYTSITDILNLLPDNTQKLISPRDARDAVFSAWENSVFRYTTIGSYEYIGLNREDIKTKIYFGKKRLLNLNVMNNTLLSSDSDIFFYNTKTDTNPSQNLKISFLGGTALSLHPYAPYLGVNQVLGTNSVNLDLNLINPGPNGGDINISSSYGKITFQNQIKFPSEADILSLVSTPLDAQPTDLYLVREGSGNIGFKKIVVNYSYIGSTGSVTNILGNPVLVNNYPLEFTELTPTVATVGGVGIGMTFSNVPLVEMIRMILYPELGPVVSIDIPNNIYERKHNISTVVPFNYTLTKRTYNITSSQRDILSGNIIIASDPAPTISGPGLITQTYNDSYTFSSGNILSSVDGIFTFSVASTDGTFSSTASNSVNFVYPYFYGFSNTLANNDSSMDSIILNDLDKRVDIKENQILSIDGTNEYLYFSYPVGYGTVSSIYDANNYLIYSHGLTPSTWTYSVINNISSPNGYWGGVSYMVYRTITKVSVPNQYYKFNFN